MGFFNKTNFEYGQPVVTSTKKTPSGDTAESITTQLWLPWGITIMRRNFLAKCNNKIKNISDFQTLLDSDNEFIHEEIAKFIYYLNITVLHMRAGNDTATSHKRYASTLLCII